MGICLRSSVPGFVVDFPRFWYRMRTGFKILSIVAGDIASKTLIVDPEKLIFAALLCYI